MELNLRNPLVFIDVETTGLNIAQDRIVELTYLKIYPNGKEEFKTYRINPEIPIDPKATAVHGITNEDVNDAPTFKEIAQTLANELEGCDFAGFNSNKFDFPLLVEEFLRAGVEIDLKKRKFIDVQVIFHRMEQRTLSAAYKLYCNKDLVDAHSSRADTYATYEVLKAQLDKYVGKPTNNEELNGKQEIFQNDVDFLSRFSSHNRNVDFVGRIIYDDKGREVFNFGKYKGMLVEEVLAKDPSYYSWMMNGDFPLYTKKVLTQIKLRSFNK